jgi:hypothetical protein
MILPYLLLNSITNIASIWPGKLRKYAWYEGAEKSSLKKKKNF